MEEDIIYYVKDEKTGITKEVKFKNLEKSTTQKHLNLLLLIAFVLIIIGLILGYVGITRYNILG
jgi:uncharacterized membrane protein YidH (DUF202 family)